jgi:hypothetical protein
MTRRFATGLALVFFVGWLVILLAGADFPPPAGFVWIVLLDAVAGGCVRYRIPHYLHWQSTGRPGRMLRALGDGIAIGLVFALLIVLLPYGEPSVVPTVIDVVIWFMVLATVGAMSTVLVYACTAVFRRMHGG